MTRAKQTVRTISIPAGITTGVLCALTTTLCATAITAKTVQLQWLDQNHIKYAVMIILLISAWIGASVSYAKIRQRKPLICLLTGLAFFCVMLGIKFLFFEGQVSGVGETAILILGGSFLTVFMKTEKSSRKKRRSRKGYNR